MGGNEREEDVSRIEAKGREGRIALSTEEAKGGEGLRGERGK